MAESEPFLLPLLGIAVSAIGGIFAYRWVRDARDAWRRRKRRILKPGPAGPAPGSDDAKIRYLKD